MRSLGRVRGALLVLSLVPGFFFLEHVGADGFPTAEGMSGAGPGAPVAPPRNVRIMRDGSASSVTVATDGFFLLETDESYGVSTALSSTIVSVTTLDGQEVPGKLEVFTGSRQTFLGWSADAWLQDGAKLKAVVAHGVRGLPVLPDQVELHVSGRPAELAGTALAFGDWIDFRHGVGETVTCPTFPIDGCSSVTTRSMLSAEERLFAAHVSYRAPEDVKSYVLWEVHVAPDAPAVDLGILPVLVIHPSTQPLPLGSVSFPKDAAKHCATLIVKDLRTGESRDSRECTTPGPTTELVRDFPLESCSAPPSAELTRAWCELYPESTLQACTGKAPPPTDPPLTCQEADDVAPAEPHTSSSCQFGAAGVEAANVSLLLAALGFGAFRRRRVRN